MRGGGYSSAMLGLGIIPEGAGLIDSGMASGIAFQLWFKQRPTGYDSVPFAAGKIDSHDRNPSAAVRAR